MLLGKTPEKVLHYANIPFLPVEMFKTQRVQCGSTEAEAIYRSSSTTGRGQSSHYVKELDIYRESCMSAFRLHFGDPSDWCILSLLPSYLEREDSSLVQMADWLQQASGHPKSGFFLDNFDALKDILLQNEANGVKSMLLGVSFALLDFAAAFRQTLRHTTVIETGGMKGRRKEVIRQELHAFLQQAWGLDGIASEYGMTECLSQAWSVAGGKFNTPAWMKVLIRDPEDPLSWQKSGRTGGINIIDLANLHSCSFLATSDLGKSHEDQYFEVLGRFDNSDVRGCSLMVG